MDLLTNAFQALPSIAFSPFSFVGYALALGAWVYTRHRSENLKILVKQISQIPEQDRKSAISAAIGEILPNNISAEQWILSKRQQYFLVAFIISLIVVVIISAIAIYQGTEIARAKEAERTRITICENQIRNINYQWDQKKYELEQRIKEIDNDIEYWILEYRRGSAGLAFAPIEQKQIAIDLMDSSEKKIAELNTKKDDAKKTLDSFVATPPVSVNCRSDG